MRSVSALDLEHVAIMREALGPDDWRTAVRTFAAAAEAELADFGADGLPQDERRAVAHRLVGLCLNMGAAALADLVRAATATTDAAEAARLRADLDDAVRYAVAALEETLH